MSDRPDISDVQASGVPITVVAVKIPGRCILRAIGAFMDQEKAVAILTRYVAIVDGGVEWTTHTYKVPGYLIYGSGDLPGWDWPQAGVYRFPYNGGKGRYATDTYGGPAELMEAL